MRFKMKKFLSFFLTIVLAVSVVPVSGIIPAQNNEVKAATFSIRSTAPEKSNQYYYSSKNPFYSSGYAGQCTWYAYGRAYEILGEKPNLCLNSAKDWYGYNKTKGYYKYGSVPKVGAIVCWANAQYGHVGVVEKVISNTDVYISEANVAGGNWKYRHYDPKTWNSNFQGYIYLLNSVSTPTPTPAPTKDKKYPTPIKAYTINTGKTTVYNAISGSAKANKIYDTDLCTISAIYTNGWCKVTFPLDKGGTDSGYVKTSVFFNPSYDVFNMKTGKQITTYTRNNLKASTGYAGSGDKVYVIGHTSGAVQIAYPLTAGGYKAAWMPISVLTDTIKYNANGGTGTMSNTSVKYKGSIKLAANKYTKKGYTFGGWNVYRGSDKTWYAGNNGWNTESIITSKKYTKSVYKNSWSGVLDKSWLTGSKTNDTYTFYAVWNPNKLNVTFNVNGGVITSDTYKINNNIICLKSDNSVRVQSWTYNSTKENGLCNASTFGLARTGYKFAGWGTKSSGGTIFDQKDSALTPVKINPAIEKGSCSTVLYAIWTPVTYAVKYDANGGSNAPAAQTKTYGKSLTLSNEKPVREGYEFLGWSTDKTSQSAAYQPGAAYTKESAVTLYAVWKETYVPPVHVHEWNSGYTVDREATCTEEGLKSIHCKTCGETKEAVKIPVTGHSYTEVIVREATCTENGIKVKRCTSCGSETDRTEIPVTEHSFVPMVTKEATCSEEGIKEDICAECNLHANKEMLPKLEHVFEDWKTVTEATAKNSGTESRKCINCEYEETREVEYVPVYDESSPRISLETVHAKAGEEVTVALRLENNPGITSMRFVLDYDIEALTMTDFSFGEALASMNRASSEKYGSPYSFSMYSASEDLTDNGVLAVIKFKVNEDIKDGEYMIALNYDYDDIFNMAGDRIEMDVEEGFICVDEAVTGDVNSDGSINMRDVVLLQQVINGWDVKYNMTAADFNKDKKVNMRDIVALQQYINR